MPEPWKRTTNCPFWDRWREMMETTGKLLSRYREHEIKFTVNPEMLKEAKRTAKKRKK